MPVNMYIYIAQRFLGVVDLKHNGKIFLQIVVLSFMTEYRLKVTPSFSSNMLPLSSGSKLVG